MKITIEIPDDLFRQAEAGAAQDGTSLCELFVHGMRLALKHPRGSQPGRRVDFPLIRSGQSTVGLTDEQVNATLDNDDDLG